SRASRQSAAPAKLLSCGEELTGLPESAAASPRSGAADSAFVLAPPRVRIAQNGLLLVFRQVSTIYRLRLRAAAWRGGCPAGAGHGLAAGGDSVRELTRLALQQRDASRVAAASGFESATALVSQRHRSGEFFAPLKRLPTQPLPRSADGRSLGTGTASFYTAEDAQAAVLNLPQEAYGLPQKEAEKLVDAAEPPVPQRQPCSQCGRHGDWQRWRPVPQQAVLLQRPASQQQQRTLARHKQLCAAGSEAMQISRLMDLPDSPMRQLMPDHVAGAFPVSLLAMAAVWQLPSCSPQPGRNVRVSLLALGRPVPASLSELVERPAAVLRDSASLLGLIFPKGEPVAWFGLFLR
uniref:SHR-BD domain-containing protein n=1 Tax=Macrostomum lignano TaxID=282301 RepID=A0A1I8JLK1_9PLAT